MNASMPDAVAEIRAEICARCQGCDERRAGLIDPHDPGAACPQAHWGRYVTTALPVPQTPPLWLKIKRLARELAWWWLQGKGWVRLVQVAVYVRRRRICGGCDYFNAKGNWRLGECQAPGCGCTKAKLWLPTAHCPHPDGPRWGRE